MPKLIIGLPDELYRELEEEAKEKGGTVEEVALERLKRNWVGGALKDYAFKGKSFDEIMSLEEKRAEAGFVRD